MLRRKHHSKL